jgi:mannose-6-phosphate isomerase-like protein (cupin superfamily)
MSNTDTTSARPLGTTASSWASPDVRRPTEGTKAKRRLSTIRGSGGSSRSAEASWPPPTITPISFTAPDKPHADEEVYIVEGTGVLDVDGEQIALREGHAVFVSAG